MISSKERNYFFIACIGCFFFQVFSGHVGSYHKAPLVFATIDLIFTQNIFMCLVFMVLFHRCENYKNKLINLIAATSFAVYFIHPFIIVALGKLDVLTGLQNWYVFVIFVFTVILICVAMAFIFKYYIPKHSRLFKGF
ncbi:MAG: acyltransferase family protein [Neptunomonas phycophila]